MLGRLRLRARTSNGAESTRRLGQAASSLAIGTALGLFLTIVLTFQLTPLVWSFYLGLHSWSGVGDPRWIGFGNFLRVLGDPTIQAAFINTGLLTTTLVPLLTSLSLLLALILNHHLLPLRGMLRILIFLPYITPAVVSAIIFTIVFNERFGHVNMFLDIVGFPGISWLKTAAGARFVVILVAIWQVLGYTTLIALGGLQTLPTELYEAALLDGASAWQRFWNITLPLMSGTLAVVSIISLLFVLNLFSPYFLFPATNGYGPERSVVTVSVVQYVYAFANRRYGDAAAVGTLVGLIGFLLALLQIRLWRLSRGWS
ncbi:MAG: sugar ABC transporter permease [Thermomicrobium sp.]|nr:sugar ABC transporter permease [Thermomicrobium sp.]MDW8007050.1 sugar ABC transporter permease [Thermomicrobium sp.]